MKYLIPTVLSQSYQEVDISNGKVYESNEMNSHTMNINNPEDSNTKDKMSRNSDPLYSECICPKCHETTVHHMGAPCRHYSCPKCGEMMERRGEHEKPIKEGAVVRLPDGSGFFTGTVGKPKTAKNKKRKSMKEKYSLYTDFTVGLNKLYENEYTIIESYLESLFPDTIQDTVQQEDFLGSLKKAGSIVKAKLMKRPQGPDPRLHRAYWSAKGGQKIRWPSQTADDISKQIK